MADYEYLVSTGVIVPDTSTILESVQAEYQATFGADLVVTADTPQGVLITAEALARTEVVNNNAALANQINPNIAGGIFLDAIMALTGIQRKIPEPTLVTGVTLTGVSGTTVGVGSQARTTNGDLFQTLSTVVIGIGGTVTVDFASVVNGPISCPTNSLTQVVSNVVGWETVNNTNSGSLGTNVQSDQDARAYRNNTLAFQGVSLAEAIISALYVVQGVTSVAFQENVAATTQTINGISMVAHSVWACVQGGTDLNVAAALLENKSSGAAWNGGTSVSVIEPASGQTYAVEFDRPTPEPVLIKVTSTNATLAEVQAAILAYVNGQIANLQGFVIGSDVSPFEISAAIVSQYPQFYINKVEVTLASDPSGYSTDVLPIAINQIATTQANYISVVTP